MSQQKPPAAPDYGQLLRLGYQLESKYAPKRARQELRLRREQDAARIALQQAEQAQFGPTQARQQLDALKALDPVGYGLRQQLGAATSGDLARGTTIDPITLRQIRNTLGARQAAGGNVYGNAAAMAQAVYQGARAQELYRNRIAQAGSVASMLPGYVGAIQGIQGVNPDRQSWYINPNAGGNAAQFGLQNYPNQYQNAMQPNPWMNALGTAGGLAGTLVGGYWGGPVGASLGGTAGSASGSYLGSLFGSDPKMKTDIKKVANVPIYEYRYKAKYGIPGTFRGPMSTDVKKHDP